jgi:menaquinol-cytochrome c reductase iron-sulfur subunit
MSKRKNRETESEDQPDRAASNGGPEGRRSFLEKAAAFGVGTVAGAAPVVAGVYTFLDPLCPKEHPGEAATAGDDAGPGKWVQVVALDEVVPGEPPKRFPIITDSWDAWNYYPPHPVGAVYLQRHDPADPNKVTAHTATCPHLGCTVKFQIATNTFACPCHDSVFTPDGKKLPEAVSPRDMDELEIDPEKLGQGEVWVRYLKFRTGKTEKVPEA